MVPLNPLAALPAWQSAIQASFVDLASLSTGISMLSQGNGMVQVGHATPADLALARMLGPDGTTLPPLWRSDPAQLASHVVPLSVLTRPPHTPEQVPTGVEVSGVSLLPSPAEPAFLAVPGGGSGSTGKTTATPRQADFDRVYRILQRLLHRQAGVAPDRIGSDPDRALIENWLDSLKHAEFISLVRKYFGLGPNEMGRLADYPSLGKIAEFLVDHLGEAESHLSKRRPF